MNTQLLIKDQLVESIQNVFYIKTIIILHWLKRGERKAKFFVIKDLVKKLVFKDCIMNLYLLLLNGKKLVFVS